jgi:CRISPR/Cas system CMR-associated protein Cmr5 small subunit
MRKEIVDQFIGNALTHIGTSGIVKSNGKISNEYKGYVSSFGTSVMQCGLIPALALFSDESSGSKDKSKIVLVLKQMLGVTTEPSLLKHALTLRNNRTAFDELEEKVLHASVALKLAIRTFEIE